MHLMLLLCIGSLADLTQGQVTQTQVSCDNCICTLQAGIHNIQCSFSGGESVLLDGTSGLDNSSTLYLRLERAAYVNVTTGFLTAIRNYKSVAVDFWNIGRIVFASDFVPDMRFRFIGVGFVNCSLYELPQGVVSNSRVVGFRLVGSTIGTIRRGAFADIDKVRYVELFHSAIDTIEGPQMGRVTLSHMQNIHHGSIGFHISGCRLDVIQEGALHVIAQGEDEFFMITNSTVGEIGTTGIEISGRGSFIIRDSTFQFLNTGALYISVSGPIIIADSRIQAVNALPLASVHGHNATRLTNLTFGTPLEAGLMSIYRPSGHELLANLTFPCRGRGHQIDTSWANQLENRSTVSDAEKRFDLKVIEAARCAESTGDVTTRRMTSLATPTAASAALFSNPAQTGLEVLIVIGLVAVVSLAAAAAAVVYWRRRRPADSDTRSLVNQSRFTNASVETIDTNFSDP